MSSPKLLDLVRTVARVKHFSLKTEDAYANWIKRFILFHHKRHPNEMAENEIRQFLAHLAVDLHVSASTQTGIELLVLFRVTRGRPLFSEHTRRSTRITRTNTNKNQRLIRVLTQSQPWMVFRLFCAKATRQILEVD